MEANYLALIIAAISAMVAGAIWYGPLFGKTWMKLTGISKKDVEKVSKKKMNKMYLMGFISYLVTAWALYYFGNLLGYETAKDWATLGFCVGLAFVGFGSKPNYIWENRSKKLWLLNTAFAAVSMALMGWVFTLV